MGKNVCPFDNIETYDRIKTREAFIGSIVVKFLSACGDKIIYFMLSRKCIPYILFKNEEMEKTEDVNDYFYKRDAELKRQDDGG